LLNQVQPEMVSDLASTSKRQPGRYITSSAASLQQQPINRCPEVHAATQQAAPLTTNQRQRWQCWCQLCMSKEVLSAELTLCCLCWRVTCSSNSTGELLIPPPVYQTLLGWPANKTAVNSFVAYTINW
jgi:hypothetical protein